MIIDNKFEIGQEVWIVRVWRKPEKRIIDGILITADNMFGYVFEREFDDDLVIYPQFVFGDEKNALRYYNELHKIKG